MDKEEQARIIIEAITRVFFTNTFLNDNVGSLVLLVSRSRPVAFPFMLTKANGLGIQRRFGQEANSILLPKRIDKTVTSILKTDLVTGKPRKREYNVKFGIKDFTVWGKYLQKGFDYINTVVRAQLISPADMLTTLEELCTGSESSQVDTFALWCTDGTFFPYCILENVSFDEFFNFGKFTHAFGSLSVKAIDPYRAVDIL